MLSGQAQAHAQAPPPKFKIYLGRHGQSQANLIEQPIKELSIKDWQLLRKARAVPGDPTLSLTGVIQTKKTAKILAGKGLKPDFVFCSNLFRAMQTALLTFPNSEIHVVPYLKEEMDFADNMCFGCNASANSPFKTLSQQLEMRCQNPDDLKRLRFHTNLFDQKNFTQDCAYSKSAINGNGDIKKCLNEIIIPFLSKTAGRMEPYQIAIITHSKVITTFLAKYSNNLKQKHLVLLNKNKKVKPTNNLIVEFNKDQVSLDELRQYLEKSNTNVNIQSEIFFTGWHNRESQRAFNKCNWFTRISTETTTTQQTFFKINESDVSSSIQDQNLLPQQQRELQNYLLNPEFIVKLIQKEFEYCSETTENLNQLSRQTISRCKKPFLFIRLTGTGIINQTNLQNLYDIFEFVGYIDKNLDVFQITPTLPTVKKPIMLIYKRKQQQQQQQGSAQQQQQQGRG